MFALINLFRMNQLFVGKYMNNENIEHVDPVYDWIMNSLHDSDVWNKEHLEEAEAQNNLIKDIFTVRAAIREKYPKSDKFVHDTIKCPICEDGIVSFIISDHVNGHIHAECSNHKNGCVKWME